MKLNRLNIRRWILVILTLTVFCVFVARLMNIQIVQAEEIRRSLEQGTISTQTVKATRGEIVDRNGLSMVSNSLGYDVVIDKAFFPRTTQNDIILELIRLFEENGESWIDELPVTWEEPFEFLADYEKEAANLKAKLEIQDYSTVEHTMFRLFERYQLEDYEAADARKIAGVRYEMERRGFNNQYPYTFAKDIDISLVLKIKERSHLLSGVDISESALRSFDMGDIAPHIVGRTGRIFEEDWPEYEANKDGDYAMDDIVGLDGVEKAFEDELRGKNGKRIITVDASGQTVEAQDTELPIPGNTIVLTIDSKLQDTAQRALAAQIKNLQESALPGQGKEADVGAVAVIHVKTGQILALATFPSYDQATFSTDYRSLVENEQRPLLNRALNEWYAPGSTFKPVVATAALATGKATEQTVVNCGMVYTRFTDYQPRCLSAHGGISLNRALSVSCNIYFYDVGWNTGIDAIDRYAQMYGLGEPTGIELNEVIGQRSNPQTQLETKGEKWNNGDVLQTSIGQLVQHYSPLQLANYAATIANRGQRMKLTIVKEIQDYAREKTVKPSKPEVAARVDATPETFESVIGGMITASRTGSASAHFGNYPIDVASKTGTPETSIALPNSTFICFAPAQEPEIAIAVVIEKGWHGYTGAPVAKAIMDEYFGIESANPLLPRETEDQPATEQAQGETSGSGESQESGSAEGSEAGSQESSGGGDESADSTTDGG